MDATGTLSETIFFDPPFMVTEPSARRIPFVFSSPHSGQIYPPAFLATTRLDPVAIRRSEDTLVDELFGAATQRGAPLIRALFPRSWLDVNREPYELDPKMFSGDLPAYANVRSARVAGGLGTVARVVADHEEIYAAPLSVEEVLCRIHAVYMPFHEALRRLVAETHASFGTAVLIDCHSMPSLPRAPSSRKRPDFVLGDRHGTSCAAELMDAAAAFLTGLGYTVGRNKPYAGGFITEHYGRPHRSLHALQIEVNRALYLDEQEFTKTAGFAPMQELLGELVDTLAAVAESSGGITRAAAE